MAIIMIVDDSETLRMSLNSLLAAAGHQVVEAENGLMGLELWKKYQGEMSLIIADYNMPVLDGMSMVKKIRDLPEGKQIIVFMLSTESSQAKKDLGKELGIRAWITKPFSNEKILLAISKVLA